MFQWPLVGVGLLIMATSITVGLGVAIIDEFSVCAADLPGVVRVPISTPTPFKTFAAVNADEPLSIFAEGMIEYLRTEMRDTVQNPPYRRQMD
jgi:hypothetical protein